MKFKEIVMGVVVAIVIVISTAVLAVEIKESTKENMETRQFITIEQSDDLWLQYDKDTNIVFMVQKSASYGRGAYLRIPYPAENGLPYRYNSNTGELEIIAEE